MKLLLILLCAFLVACSSEEITGETTIDIQPVETVEPAAQQEPAETQENPNLITLRGVEHIVEVIDVTSDGESCLINIDGTYLVVDSNSTAKHNGVQVYVGEVHAIHSSLDDKDICEIEIS